MNERDDALNRQVASAILEGIYQEIDMAVGLAYMTPFERRVFERRFAHLRRLDFGQLVELMKRREARRHKSAPPGLPPKDGP